MKYDRTEWNIIVSENSIYLREKNKKKTYQDDWIFVSVSQPTELTILNMLEEQYEIHQLLTDGFHFHISRSCLRFPHLVSSLCSVWQSSPFHVTTLHQSRCIFLISFTLLCRSRWVLKNFFYLFRSRCPMSSLPGRRS